VTLSLLAVLGTLLEEDQPRTRTAGEIATLADRSDTTVIGVLSRLVTDRHVDTKWIDRKSTTGGPARPVMSYTLNAGGVTYARGVLSGRTSTAGE
jgi:hypothetical protein